MKVIVMGIIPSLLLILLASGCGSQLSAPPVGASVATQAKQPTKEILVTYGDYDKPYDTLGSVEYTLKAAPTSNAQIELWDQAIDSLKKAALSQYGDRVDAIIGVELVESSEELVAKEELDVIHVQGTAITFNAGAIPANKQKVKYKARYKKKHAKAVSSKPSKKAPEKTQEEEIEISPSELLK